MAVLDKNICVLIIEDNPGDYVLIEEYLLTEAEHPDIHHAETLAEATDRLKNGDQFDAILLDLTLPDADGQSLVKRVADLSEDTPVIVLTGYENKEFGLKTLSMGISDYLLKDELNPFLLAKSISYSIERNRINRSLRQSEKQYRDLFNLSPLPKWVYDAETLRFLDVNKIAIEHYGYSEEEFLSMTIKDIRPEEDIPILEENLEQDDESRQRVYRHQKKDGSIIQVDLQSTDISYYGRKARMVVADDITEQLEAERALAVSEQRFKSLVQDGSDLITIIDPEGTYKYVAPTSETVLGIPAEEFVGTNVFDYIHEDDHERIAHVLSALDEQDRIEVAPFQLRDAEGNWRWIETVITNMLDNPVVEGYVANSRDVTENIEREKKLRKSLERYNYVSKATDDIIYDWDIDEDDLTWDMSFRSKFLYDTKADKYTIEQWENNVHPDDIQQTTKNLNKTLDDPSQSKWEAEYRFQKQNRSYATVFERGFILRDDEGNAIRMIGTLQDITERKEYEEKLEELSLVASKTTDIIIMTDPDEHITWVNTAFEELTGYTFDEAKGKIPGNLLQGPETNPQTVQRLANSIENRKSIQEVILNYSKNGEKYWLDLTIDPIFDAKGTCTGFIAIEKDVTEQIERQRKLRKSVDRYDIVAKATSDTIWDLNLEDDTIQYNQNIYNMFGYDKDDVKEDGQWWRDKIHPEDRPKVLQQLEKVLSAGTDRFQMKYRYRSADGSYKNIYDRAFIVTDDDDNPIRIIGAMQDVTQQKQEQEWLKLFESAIATTNESVAIIEAEPNDLPGRKIKYVNEAFKEMSGYSEDEAVGRTLAILNGPETSKGKRRQLEESMQQWQACEAELINYKKNGNKFWIYVSMAPVQNADGSYSHWVCIGRDVTEQKQKETQLRESLKEKETLLLEIHHRVKNNLAVVSGMVQLQAYEEDDQRIRQKLFDSVTRIQTMGSIHELLYQSESFTKLDFNENIKKLITEITETFQTEIDLETIFNLEKIHLNINQAIPCSLIVNEVITNILKHAFTEKTEGTMTIDLSSENETLHLKIIDDGKGLPDNFNTSDKERSLGLKLIETLATQLGADYSYRSNDQGTEFSLSFEKADVKGIGSAHLIRN